MSHADVRSRIALAALALIVIGSERPAQAAPVIVHESIEFLFENGGTHVTGCFGLGCPAVSFEFGTVSGELLWQVQEKVFHDVSTDRTMFTYALFNETLSPAISHFRAANTGFQGAGQAPPGWTFSQTSTGWAWQSSAPEFGIEAGLFLDGFSVELAGLIPVGFDLAAVTLTDGQSLSSPEWRVSSPVPEPASLLLVIVGLSGLAARARRRARDDVSPWRH